ncbi:MAG: PAC2 family protein [Candidatus Caldarchaeum sp.]
MLNPVIVDEPPVKPIYLVTGLPDMGNVAGIAMEHLVKTLGMKVFGVIHGFWPPYVMHRKGEVVFRRSSFRFYRTVEQRVFIVMTGEHQPQEVASLYDLAEAVVSFARRLGVERIISVGAAHRGSVSQGRVFYAATARELSKLAEEAGAEPLSDEGYITGFNGLVLGIGHDAGLEGVCLLGEIDNPEIPQPLASRNLLRVLSKIVGLENLDMTALEEAAEKIKAQMLFTEEVSRVMRQFRRTPPGVV